MIGNGDAGPESAPAYGARGPSGRMVDGREGQFRAQQRGGTVSCDEKLVSWGNKNDQNNNIPRLPQELVPRSETVCFVGLCDNRGGLAHHLEALSGLVYYKNVVGGQGSPPEIFLRGG